MVDQGVMLILFFSLQGITLGDEGLLEY